MAVLRQYVAGTLPPAEQHRVEAHTLSCTRCADILDGLSQTDLATTDRALTDLHARLHARLANEAPEVAPVVPLWPWRQLAAAVLLLLVSAAVWLGVRRTTEGPAAASQVAMRRSETKADVTAKTQPEASSSSKPTAPQNAFVSADEAVAAAPVPAERAPLIAANRQPRTGLQARSRPRILADRKEPEAVGMSGVDVAGVAAAPENDLAASTLRSADTVQVASNGNSSDLSRQASPVEMSRARKAKTNASAAIMARVPAAEPATVPVDRNTLHGQIVSAAPAPAGMRVVRGQVTDRSSGAGLPGVTVLAKGTAIGASTAADGSFSLLVPESVKTLTFHSVGFVSSEQAISPSDSAMALALAPDSKSLNEVVVVRRERPPAPISIGALPAGGYKAFQEYLKQKLEYPEKALKDGKEGTVKLKFVVAADGSLQDITVLRGLSKECDAEAIRLLKEGPKWYPAIAKGQRTTRTVEISVPFRLEDQR